jgi:hypothetical protein
MTDQTQDRVSKLVDQLYAKHNGNLRAMFVEFEGLVRADPTLGGEIASPAFQRVIKSELLKRGGLAH